MTQPILTNSDLIKIIAMLCDSQKRMERAILYGDAEHYIGEAAELRKRIERIILPEAKRAVPL